MKNNLIHKAGFVSILGKPNVGKSTLMNLLMGQKLSIITSKAQTTRHRIIGIVNGKNFQIVFSDTPGIIKPVYALQESMMKATYSSLLDSDLIMYIVDIFENEVDEELIKKLNNSSTPLILLINKIDLINEDDKISFFIDKWKKNVPTAYILPISALNNENIDLLFKYIMEKLPDHPPYYSKDTLTDRPERFFASEILREKILLNYRQEIPYSTEVKITEFKEEETIIKMKAEIFVERNSQKYIMIGKKGESLKRVGTAARLDLEKFFLKKVFIEIYVKVLPNWRKHNNSLSKFGY